MEAVTYARTLVSYVDLLGFADSIRKSQTNPDQISKILQRLAAIKLVGSGGTRPHAYTENQMREIFVSFSFSDLTVRAIKIEERAVPEIVDWELAYLADHQISLALQGVLMRGAICTGDLFTSGTEIVFGPALVKAYNLERDYAIYPRVVIDRELVFEAEERGYYSRLADYLQRGDDGAYYLDYLFGASITEYVLGSAEVATARIDAHRKMIELVIEDDIRGKDERFKSKYIWLALYHNDSVKRLFCRNNGIGDLSQLLIRESLLQF